jgi:hypothetical protein
MAASMLMLSACQRPEVTTCLLRTAARSFAVARLHCGKTASAAAMAARVSRMRISGNVAIGLPVAGFRTCE